MGHEEAAYTAIFPATLATAACPVTVLSSGRKLHDRTATSVMTKGAVTSHHGRPVAADATAAPVRSKKIPTLAHSFNNGKCGRRIAIAPRIFQVKKERRQC
jgi:hypothetical protein